MNDYKLPIKSNITVNYKLRQSCTPTRNNTKKLPYRSSSSNNHISSKNGIKLSSKVGVKDRRANCYMDYDFEESSNNKENSINNFNNISIKNT